MYHMVQRLLGAGRYDALFEQRSLATLFALAELKGPATTRDTIIVRCVRRPACERGRVAGCCLSHFVCRAKLDRPQSDNIANRWMMRQHTEATKRSARFGLPCLAYSPRTHHSRNCMPAAASGPRRCDCGQRYGCSVSPYSLGCSCAGSAVVR